MQNQDQPAALSRLEVQMAALLQRSVHDDVPTDVHKEIVEAFGLLHQLKGELTAQAAMKKPHYRKK